MLTKQAILDQLLFRSRSELARYEGIAKQAHQDAISSESKQEGKYDTRAIEAGYLAGAQRRRYEELLLDVQKLEALDLRLSNSECICAGSLLRLECDGGSAEWYFLSPSGGGLDLDLNDVTVRIISLASPLGKALIAFDPDEVQFTLKLAGTTRTFHLLEIL